MTEPRTQSGRARLMLITALYGDGDPPRWLLDRIADVENEARAAILDELEAAVSGMEATCHDGEGLRCEHVGDWPGVPGAPFDDGCNTDVDRASVLSLIRQHRETT